MRLSTTGGATHAVAVPPEGEVVVVLGAGAVVEVVVGRGSVVPPALVVVTAGTVVVVGRDGTVVVVGRNGTVVVVGRGGAVVLVVVGNVGSVACVVVVVVVVVGRGLGVAGVAQPVGTPPSETVITCIDRRLRSPRRSLVL
jgi:hypothetical protein